MKRENAAAAAISLAVAGGLLLAAAGAGTRLGLWHFRTGFSLLEWAAYAGLASAAVAVAALALKARPALSYAALLLGLAVAAVPWLQRRSARAYPAIHDISTDTLRPPVFVALLPARQGAPNPSEYGGAEVARLQKAAYPDLESLDTALSPAEAFARVERVARSQGWDVVSADALARRLEATDTTFWFGFKDDVVVRVTPTSTGSRVDARSVSRVGKGDAGANARRLRRFLRALDI